MIKYFIDGVPHYIADDKQVTPTSTENGTSVKTPDELEIGRRIKKSREKAGLTQEELGNALGLNKSTIQRYESDKVARIKLPVLKAIAIELGVNPEYLVLQTSEYKNQISNYGKTVKIKLLEMGKKQEWLISEIRNRFPDIYVDGSNIYKILTGEIKSGKVVSAINEILHIKKEENT